MYPWWLEKGTPSYRQYGGFDTDKMRRNAVAYGCENDAEIEDWLEINFGRDQNTLQPIHYQRPEKRLEYRGFLRMLQVVRWQGAAPTDARKCRSGNKLRQLRFSLVSSRFSGRCKFTRGISVDPSTASPRQRGHATMDTPRSPRT